MFNLADKRILILILTSFILVSCYAQPQFEPYPPSPITLSQSQAITLEYQRTKKQNDALLRSLHNVEYPEYRIQPGDVFEIFIFGEKELRMPNVMVRLDGFASVYLAGELQVQGKTLREFKRLIERKYLDFYEAPEISVIPQKIQSPNFTILGEVNKPNIYLMERKMTLLEGIAQASGLATQSVEQRPLKFVSLQKSYIIRQNRVLPVDFDALLTKGDLQHNIPLLPGDHIYIAPLDQAEIYVLGEVNSPRFVFYQKGTSLTKVVSEAKGLKIGAQLDNFHLVRGSLKDPKIYKINFQSILDGSSPDIYLEPGDIIYVPPTGWAMVRDFFDTLTPALRIAQTGFFIFDVLQRTYPPF